MWPDRQFSADLVTFTEEILNGKFEINTCIYIVNKRIHSEHEKIESRKNSVFWHFSRIVNDDDNSTYDSGHKLAGPCIT